MPEPPPAMETWATAFETSDLEHTRISNRVCARRRTACFRAGSTSREGVTRTCKKSLHQIAQWRRRKIATAKLEVFGKTDNSSLIRSTLVSSKAVPNSCGSEETRRGAWCQEHQKLSALLKARIYLTPPLLLLPPQWTVLWGLWEHQLFHPDVF